MADVSVIILTFNEEANLPAALDSAVGWAREVFVVDSYSTDGTIDVALTYAGRGVRVVQHGFLDYADQWNWALSHLPLSGAWTMKLDADERLTEALRREIDARIAAAGAEVQGFYVRYEIVFMGKRLRWGGIGDNHGLRLWRTNRGRFEDRSVNEHIILDGGTANLRNPLLHHNTKSITDWIEKHNRYASMEARNLITGNVTGGVRPRWLGRADERRMALRRLYYSLPFRQQLYFLYRYIVRLGFLDGRTGFRYWTLYTGFLQWIDLKREEHRRTGILPAIPWPERGAPHPAVAGSPLQHEVDRAEPGA